MSNKKENLPALYADSHIRLVKHRTLFLAEDVSVKSASDISAMLLYLDAIGDEEITLNIHSNGGSVAGLDNIYDVMQLLRSPIKTVCVGKAYSAGAVLLAAGSIGRRYALKHSNIMIHGIQAQFPIPGHDLNNSKNYYDFLYRHNSNIIKILAKHTGHTVAKVREDCLQDVFMTPKQAKSYGIIDHIIG